MRAPQWPAAPLAVLALAACTATAPPQPAAPSTPAPGPSGTSTVPPPVAAGLPHGYSPGADTAGDPLFPRLGNGGYDVAHYALAFTYDAGAFTIDADELVTATATQALSRFDLDLRGLSVRSVTVNGRPAAFGRVAEKLVVAPPAGITVTTPRPGTGRSRRRWPATWRW